MNLFVNTIIIPQGISISIIFLWNRTHEKNFVQFYKNHFSPAGIHGQRLFMEKTAYSLGPLL